MHRRGVSSNPVLGDPTVIQTRTIPCRPSGALSYLCVACYKHIAPLGLKAPITKIQGDVSAIVGARLPRPAGWGSQPLRVQGCATIPHCAPLERGDYRHVSRCYRHIAPLAPLGLKAPMHQNSRCVMHRRGGVASPDGLGHPTPTGSGVCHNTTLRSSGARGLDVSRCYRHIAPLERKAKPNHPPSPNPY